MIAGSLLSPADSEQKLNAFYAKLHTPINLDPHQDQQNVRDSANNPAAFDRDRLTKWRNLELLKPGRRDIGGFLTAWAVVAAILAATIFLIKFGA